jgi:hypothetical protein
VLDPEGDNNFLPRDMERSDSVEYLRTTLSFPSGSWMPSSSIEGSSLDETCALFRLIAEALEDSVTFETIISAKEMLRLHEQ